MLDRYYQAATQFSAEVVVRVTSDCPLIDPSVIDLVIEKFLNSKSDYTSNTLKVPFPDGQDVEVFTYKSLEKAWNEAKLLSEREHVTPYIKNNSSLFKVNWIEGKQEQSKYRWCLDEPKDLELITAIYDALYPKNKQFGMKEILELLEEQPTLKNINSHIIRDEGYLKSLKQDKLIK